MLLATRLTVDGEILPITGFNYVEPTGVLGGSLTVALARPEVNQIPPGAGVTFEIGAGRPDGAGGIEYSFIKLMDSGRVAGRTATTLFIPDASGGVPGDVVEFNALNPLADKWGLAPERPTILYNPGLVDADSLKPDSNALIRESGTTDKIEYVLTPVEGLKLLNVLDAAYVAGCGFSKVITNIPNFKIDRADFTLEGGFHGGVSPLLQLFNPVFFEDNNVLFIIDPERGLPSGFTPKSYALKCIRNATEVLTPTELVNVIIMSYKTSSGNQYYGYIPSIRYEYDDPYESGSGKSYTRTEVFRRLTDYKDLTTGEVIDTREDEVTTTVYAYREEIIINVAGTTYTRTKVEGSVRLISEEIVQNFYQGSVQTGYFKTVYGVYENPEVTGVPDAYGLLLEEEGVFDWTADLNNPGEYLLRRSEVVTRGLVVKETLDESYEDNITGRTEKHTYAIYTPILEAMQSDTLRGDSTQVLEFLPITTVTEELRASGVNQSTVNTRRVNHLTGQQDVNVTQNRPGSRGTYNPGKNPPGGNVRRERLQNLDSIALYGRRKAASLDIGYLDPVEGRKIATRRLNRFSSPPVSKSGELAFGIDFRLRRGSVRTLPLRNGGGADFIITSRSFSGRSLDNPDAAEISQSFESIKLG